MEEEVDEAIHETDPDSLSCLLTYDYNADTILQGFGLSEEHQKKLVEKYFSGSRSQILNRICNDNTELSDSEKYSLLVEFGSRLVLDEVNLMTEEHEAYLKSKEENSSDILQPLKTSSEKSSELKTSETEVLNPQE